MKGTSREIFLERVRTALGRGERSQPPSCQLDHGLVRRPLQAAEDVVAGRIERFEDKARAVGMSVLRCQREDLLKTLSEWIESKNLSRVLLSDHPYLEPDMGKNLEVPGVEICSDQIDLDTLYDQIDCGITVATAAVAETGSVVLSSSEKELRLASLVPPRHLVVVSSTVLVDDLLDLSARGGVLDGRTGEIPSAVTLVTGPSKTADIEGVLVTGVHGPGEVQIVVVDER